LRNEDELGGEKMNPSPEQVSEWERRAEKAWNIDDNISNFDVTERGYIQGYLRARTEQATEIAELKAQRDLAISMLVAWCVAVDENGSGWDNWDEYYKDAMYRPSPLRELLDAHIASEREQRKD
jgi:hypothetical protein